MNLAPSMDPSSIPLVAPIPTRAIDQLAPIPLTPGLFSDKPENWGLESKPTGAIRRQHHRANSSSSLAHDASQVTSPRIHRRVQSDIFFSQHSPLSISADGGYPPSSFTNGMFDARPMIPASGHRRVSSGNTYRSRSPAFQNNQFSFMNAGVDLYRNPVSHTPQSSVGSISDIGSPAQFNQMITPHGSPSSFYPPPLGYSQPQMAGSPFPGVASPQMSEFYRPSTPPYSDSLVNGLGGINMHNVDTFNVAQPLPLQQQIFGSMRDEHKVEWEESDERRCNWVNCDTRWKNVEDLVKHIVSDHIGVCFCVNLLIV